MTWHGRVRLGDVTRDGEDKHWRDSLRQVKLCDRLGGGRGSTPVWAEDG